MKTYEIIFKQNMKKQTIRCTQTGLKQTIKTIEDDGGEIIEVKLRKKSNN